MKPRFILKKVVFEPNSWRKLSGLEIPIFPRLTVIAGHNGIGKSSILGFIANASGLLAEDIDGRKSYFGTEFISKFEQQFRLAPADITAGVKDSGYIFLTYAVDGGEVLKVCNIGKASTPTSGKIRYRVVPRTRGEEDFATQMGVKKDGKIPIPTIFVSVARTWPIGESSKVEVRNSMLEPADAEFIRKFHNRIIPGELTEGAANELDVSLSERRILRTQHPTYRYDTSAISLGQGALAYIATALASFRWLKRQLKKNYPGGMLVIDEIEAGLHPRAQVKLAEILLQEAKQLNLQVVVTTHSIVFLEQIYNVAKNKEAIDGIIYLMDTKTPRVKDLTLREMQEEMLLSKTAFSKKRKKELFVYMEDYEALFFLKQIIKFGKIDEKSLRVTIRKVSLKMGCGELVKLARNESAKHFCKHSVCVLDGDQKTKDLEGLDNCIKLPTEAGVLRSPEREIEYFLNKAMDNQDGKERKALLERNVSWDYIQKEISDLNDRLSIIGKEDKKRRDAYKKWFSRISASKRTDILAAWVDVHSEEVSGFAEKYLKALSLVKKRLVD